MNNGQKKFNGVLTVVLIIVVILIIVIGAFWGVTAYKNKKLQDDAANAVDQYEEKTRKGKGKGGTFSNDDDENTSTGYNLNNIDLNSPVSNSSGSNGTGYEVAAQTYKGFAMVGTIEIPSIQLKYPVLDRATKTSMEVSVGLVYGKLNQVGNATIMGHNYRNGTFFSNLKNVEIGDKIYITDTSGQKVEYVVYNMYQTSSTDFGYAQRDTAGKREVSLSTCTDDVKQRLIVLGKEV